ncbi:MAG: caspase family protein [Bacteroidota bacterium]
MRSPFSLVLLLLFISSSAISQDLFHVVYTGKDGVKYDCLLIEDSTGKVNVRMQFDKKKVHYLADILYQSPIETSIKGKRAVYFKAHPGFKNQTGIGNSFLTKNIPAGFKPPCFVYYTAPDKGENQTLPFVTDDASRFKGLKQITSCVQLNTRDIKEDRLNAYFTIDDSTLEAIKLIYGYGLPEMMELPGNKVVTLHFIMVANTADQGIGVSCNKDRENLEKEIKAIAKTLNIAYKPYLIAANDFTKKKLLTKLEEVDAASDDIVIFSYSGHGSRWEAQEDPYPFMNLWVTEPFNKNPKTQTELEMIKGIIRDNSLGLSEVFQLVKNKNARLNIVLGDMCNTSIGVPRPVSIKTLLTFGNSLRSSTQVLPRNPAKLKKLFISSRGDLISTAARPNEKAAGNNTGGGFFTYSFIEALRLAGSFNSITTPSWEKILTQTIDNALTLRKKEFPDGVQNGIRSLTITQ